MYFNNTGRIFLLQYILYFFFKLDLPPLKVATLHNRPDDYFFFIEVFRNWSGAKPKYLHFYRIPEANMTTTTRKNKNYLIFCRPVGLPIYRHEFFNLCRYKTIKKKNVRKLQTKNDSEQRCWALI